MPGMQASFPRMLFLSQHIRTVIPEYYSRQNECRHLINAVLARMCAGQNRKPCESMVSRSIAHFAYFSRYSVGVRPVYFLNTREKCPREEKPR